MVGEHTDTIRRALCSYVPSEDYYGPDGALAALDALVVERDAAKQDYLEIGNELGAELAAERTLHQETIRERDALRDALRDGLAWLYPHEPRLTAELCDEHIDRSGKLLGEVRGLVGDDTA